MSRPATLKDPQMSAESRKNERYNAGEAERRWQQVWAERGIFATKNDDPPGVVIRIAKIGYTA